MTENKYISNFQEVTASSSYARFSSHWFFQITGMISFVTLK
jgi:hypothetical protein